jgi:hypothetical protein
MWLSPHFASARSIRAAETISATTPVEGHMSDLARVTSQTFRSLFNIVPENGRWRATRADGLVSGLFFEREAAFRFARNAGLRETSRTRIEDESAFATQATRARR